MWHWWSPYHAAALRDLIMSKQDCRQMSKWSENLHC